MDHIGPYFFNGIRFILGSFFVSLVFTSSRIFFNKKNSVPYKKSFYFGILAGVVIAIASLLQQIGLVYTTPTKAGFLTGFYVFFTPFLAWVFYKKPNKSVWVSVPMLLLGLYFLSFGKSSSSTFSLNFGDSLELLGSFFWALHLVIVAKAIKQINILFFASVQFFTVGVVSLVLGIVTNETITWTMVELSGLEIIYSGGLSVGIAYTLQIVGQRLTGPSNAAIILSLETLVASIFSWIILDEVLTTREYFGCLLIFLGILWTEIKNK